MKKAPEWLGMVCQGKTLEEVEYWLEAAAAHGFKQVQPVLFSSGYGEKTFSALKRTLDRLGLKVVAFGVYADIYKWDQPIGQIFEGTGHDLETAIDCAHILDTNQVASWCGSCCGFAEPCPANRSLEAIRNFQANLDRILPRLEQHGVRLLFEPWHAHILKDELATALTCRTASCQLGCVLDFPNFITASQWPDRRDRIASIRHALEPHIGIIHLKDMIVSGSGEVGLPMFGRGDLTREIAEAVAPFRTRHPVIAEHFASPDELPELLDNVERWFR